MSPTRAIHDLITPCPSRLPPPDPLFSSPPLPLPFPTRCSPFPTAAPPSLRAAPLSLRAVSPSLRAAPPSLRVTHDLPTHVPISPLLPSLFFPLFPSLSVHLLPFPVFASPPLPLIPSPSFPSLFPLPEDQGGGLRRPFFPPASLAPLAHSIPLLAIARHLHAHLFPPVLPVVHVPPVPLVPPVPPIPPVPPVAQHLPSHPSLQFRIRSCRSLPSRPSFPSPVLVIRPSFASLTRSVVHSPRRSNERTVHAGQPPCIGPVAHTLTCDIHSHSAHSLPSSPLPFPVSFPPFPPLFLSLFPCVRFPPSPSLPFLHS
ncbi:unnamed protein product [Closterium sp. NIES-65]|nr:unnamed protein product [Closterium sp. NIES-65]